MLPIAQSLNSILKIPFSTLPKLDEMTWNCIFKLFKLLQDIYQHFRFLPLEMQKIVIFDLGIFDFTNLSYYKTYNFITFIRCLNHWSTHDFNPKVKSSKTNVLFEKQTFAGACRSQEIFGFPASKIFRRDAFPEKTL